MLTQIIMTINSDAPNVEAVATVVHKVLDAELMKRKALIHSFEAIEIRPGSKHVISFPTSLDV